MKHALFGDAIPPHRRRLRTLVSGGAAAALIASGLALSVAAPAAADAFNPDFGPNVKIFDPGMSADTINTYLRGLFNSPDHAEWGEGRAAVFFKPGTYGSAAGQDDPATATGIINSELGYYTTVAGLGLSPDDVTINGAIHVEASQINAEAPWDYPEPGSLINFWRSMSNLSINPIQRPVDAAPGAGPAEEDHREGWTEPHTLRWAVSQAAPLRRVHVKGTLDYMGRYGAYASGGFTSDTKIDGAVQFGSQQQFLSKNTDFGSAPTDGVWNMVYSGVTNPPAATYPDSLSGTSVEGVIPNTIVPTTPVSREAPFLTWDASNGYSVFVPNAKTNSTGAEWSGANGTGQRISINDFYLAKPSDSAATINAALTAGKHLLITPGRYRLDAPIVVRNANTVIYGIGLATLTPDAGTTVISVADVPGVKISGITIDAGTTMSDVLLKVGPIDPDNTGDNSQASNPTTLSDVFFRIGGYAKGRAHTSLEVNTDNVLLDNIWAWRADHGEGGSGNWDPVLGYKYTFSDNYAPTGVRVNGDNVTATGLFVEHYGEKQVQWNGNNGRTIFYQSELPYEVPDQAAYKDGNKDGFSSYWIDPDVSTHELTGGGVYSYFRDSNSWAGSAFRAPNKPGIQFDHVMTRFLNGNGGIRHVVNSWGKQVNAGVGHDLNTETSWLPRYDSTTDTSDTTPPVMTLTADPTAPDSGTTYTTVVDLTISATDNKTPADQIELTYRVDNRNWKPVPVDVTGKGVINPPNGTHTIQFRALDDAGNLASGTSWHGTVDAPNNPGDLVDPPPGTDPDIGGPTYPTDPDPTDPNPKDTVRPTVAIAANPTAPGGDGFYHDGVRLTMSAADNITTSPAIEYRINGGSWSTYGAMLTLTTDGAYTVEARSLDTAGNVSLTATWAGTLKKPVIPPVDTTKPIVAITSDPAAPGTSGVYTEAVTLTITAMDDISANPMIEYMLGGGEWSAYGVPLTFTADGTYTVTARATDTAGNVSNLVTWTGTIKHVVVPAPTPPAPPVTWTLGSNPPGTITVGSTLTAGFSLKPGKATGKRNWYKRTKKKKKRKVTVTAYGTAPAGTRAVVQVKVGKAPWVAYAGPFKVKKNGKTKLKARTVTMTASSMIFKKKIKIDKKKPKKLKAKAKFVKAKRIVKLKAKDKGSKIAKIQYKLRGKGKWKKYKKKRGVKITHAAVKIKFRAIDKAGNRTVKKVKIKSA